MAPCVANAQCYAVIRKIMKRASMQPSEQLRAYIHERVNAIKAGAPGWLSEDGSALMVDGGPMYCCFVSPGGQLFIESYGADKNSTRIDRSRRAQIATLVLGARNHPVLADFVPRRIKDATTCEVCSGKGFVSFEHGNIKTDPVFLCQQCSGLGWVSASVFQEPPAADQAQNG